MVDIVIGAGFGDEGKGQTVSNIIEVNKNKYGWNPNFVVRFNGGHQAGHTVEYNDLRHVFSNFGAGTLQGVPTYWSKYCTIHPKAIQEEYKVLTHLDRDVIRNESRIKPVLFIDPLCPVTLFYDIFFNQSSNPHGSVGVGFGQTIQRHEDNFKIYAQDLLHEDILKAKLENIEEWYYTREFRCGKRNMEIIKQEFLDECGWLVNGNHDIEIKRPEHLNSSIFEGAQGILLDQDLGFFPNVTRSKTTAHNALKIIEDFHIGGIIQINYVSRSYSTRHGKGYFPSEKYADYLNLKDEIIETNQLNQFQGEFRKSVLDIDMLKYAINMSELENHSDLIRKKIIFTCTNHHKDGIIPVLKDGFLTTVTKENL